jgi:hypothetical protein
MSSGLTLIMRPFLSIAAESSVDALFLGAVQISYDDVVPGQRLDLAGRKYSVAPKCEYAVVLAIPFGTLL